jgi:hypothetical protein
MKFYLKVGSLRLAQREQPNRFRICILVKRTHFQAARVYLYTLVFHILLESFGKFMVNSGA